MIFWASIMIPWAACRDAGRGMGHAAGKLPATSWNVRRIVLPLDRLPCRFGMIDQPPIRAFIVHGSEPGTVPRCIAKGVSQLRELGQT
jgi:hypothetical protein